MSNQTKLEELDQLRHTLEGNLKDILVAEEINRPYLSPRFINSLEKIENLIEAFIACLECEADLRSRGIDDSVCRTCRNGETSLAP